MNENKLSELRWWHGIGGLAALPAAFVLSLMGTSGLLAGLLVVGCGIAGAIAVSRMFDRLDGMYTRRMQVQDWHPWQVWINGVCVGEVTDAQYAALQRSVLRDFGVVARMVIELLRAVCSGLAQVAFAVPAAIFWLSVLAAATEPAAVAEFLRGLSAATTDQIASSSGFLLRAILLFSAMVAVPFFVLTGRLGRVGQAYRDDLADRLRVQCNSAAQGSVELRPPFAVADREAPSRSRA